MKTLAFIPARGGSVRLPKKNIRSFNGKPLIYYSIAFAKFHKIDKIVVSTDSQEIADVCNDMDVAVIARPAELSGNFSPTHAAAKHTLSEMTRGGFNPDVFITLQPTNPLRPQSLFNKAMDVFIKKSPDSVVSVTPNSNKYGSIDDQGIYKPLNYQPGVRSQDLEKLYYENGLMYLSRPNNILNEDFFGTNVQTVITDKLFGMMDIDEELDFDLAEFAFKKHYHLFKYLL